MPLSCGVVLAVIGTTAWYLLPTALLIALLAIMLPGYAAIWLVPLLQSGKPTAPRQPDQGPPQGH